MSCVIDLQRLHIRTQKVMYVLPILFVYIILLPYQGQLLADEDELVIIKVFDRTQEYLLLFVIWFQYLALRILHSAELKELSYGYDTIYKQSWFFLNFLLFFVAFLPYFFWLGYHVGIYADNIPYCIMQCIVVAKMTFVFIHLIQSPLAGMSLMVCYYFLCINHFIPQRMSIIRMGVLPKQNGLLWVIGQIVVCVAFDVVGVVLLRRKP